MQCAANISIRLSELGIGRADQIYVVVVFPFFANDIQLVGVL